MWIFTDEFLILQLHIRCDLLFLQSLQSVTLSLCLALAVILHIVVNILGTLFRLVCALHSRIVLFCLCNLTMHKIHIFGLELVNRSFPKSVRLKWLLDIYRNHHILCFSGLFIKDTLHRILPLFRHLILCLL